MGQLKEFYTDYLSSEDFDNMFDDEYELWLQRQSKHSEEMQEQYEQLRSAYEEALSWGR